MNTGNKIVIIVITYRSATDCIVIPGFQVKLYPVGFNFGLAKLHKSHQKINYLASYTWYNKRTESQKSLAIYIILH